MNSRSLYSSFLIAAIAAALLLATAFAVPAAHAADDASSTIKFSDPAKPGALKIRANMGDFRIRGADVPEISVKTSVTAEAAKPRADGLRVLTATASYRLAEKNNVVTLDFGFDATPSQPGEFDVTVPRNTTVSIASNYGGDVKLTDLAGDIEIKSMNGEIRLDRVSGSVLVETMNGEIYANVPTLTTGKPLSFTTMNGEVHLRVPADAKANVKMRTQNGTILTDFDDQTLVTKTQSLSSSRGARVTAEVQAAVREGMRAAREAVRESARAAREAARAAREAIQDSSDDEADNTPEAPEAPEPLEPAIAPVAPLPPMTGGKLVSGTLNGGGVDVSITTMNGDIVFRKYDPSASAKK